MKTRDLRRLEPICGRTKLLEIRASVLAKKSPCSFDESTRSPGARQYKAVSKPVKP
jgi:hypothetical protein